MSVTGILLVVVALLLGGMPVGFAFGIGGFAMAMASGTDLSYLLPNAIWQVGGYALLALPLFIIAGTLMESSGISDRLIAFVDTFVGRLRGGLGAVTVVSCALFGAMSGSGASAIAAVGPIMIPRMVAQGYPAGHATALVAVSSVLTLLIPPSISMIVFSVAAGLPVAACFLSTVIPGVLLATIYCVLNYCFVRSIPSFEIEPGIGFRDHIRRIRTATYQGILALFMPLILLGGIYSGVFTPTEAAAVALVYVVFIGFFVYRQLSLKSAGAAILEGALNTGAIIAILFFLAIMSRTMVLAQVPSSIAQAILSVSENKIAILLALNLCLLIIGMLVDDVSGSILAAIILMPVAIKTGIHPIHFAAIVGVNLGLGNITPPCAPLLYMAGSVGRVEMKAYLLPTMKFLLLGHLPMVFIVSFFPDLALFLPRLVMGIG